MEKLKQNEEFLQLSARHQDIVKEMNQLIYEYYTLDKPSQPDSHYDKLDDELKEIEEKYPVLKTPLSPSQRVGGAMLEKFEKAKHLVLPMSLKKGQDYSDVKKFVEDIYKELGRTDVVFTVELKFDGLSLFLTYENGILVLAATRGQDGYGEVVTEQVKTIKSIPLTISYKEKIQTQAEAFMPRNQLQKLNEKLEEEFHVVLKELGENPSEEDLAKLRKKYKPYNERNVASGAIRQLDPKITASRKLDAFFYNIPYIEGKTLNTQEEIFQILKDNRFKVNSHLYTANNYEELIKIIEEITELRDTLNYAIDGIVIKVNEVGVRDDIGYTSKHPKWALAFKFEADEEQTPLLGLKWQVGRTGKHTPLGLLEPVEILGATISKATLNNMDDIIRKGVKIGANVWIRRSNDVIPEILGIVEGSTGEDIVAPTHCVSCGSPLVEDGAHLFCRNHEECPAQTTNKIIHFASRGAMNIETFSEKTAEQLLDAGLITNIVDLYKLKEEDLLSLERFGKRKAQNLLKAIEDSKERPLDSFLYGLGIRHAGKGTVERLLRHYSTIEEIQNASVEDLAGIEDVGEVVAQSIYDFFKNEKNLQMISELKELGLKMHFEKQEAASTSFEGLTFVVTGSMSKARKEIENDIKINGGKVSSSVSKKTNYVVFGEDAGSKLTKAQSLGVPTITEEELYQMLNN